MSDQQQADIIGSADQAAAGRPRRRRPRPAVIIAVAACAAVVATVIAIDSTSHAAKPAAKPPLASAFALPSLRDSAQQVSLKAYNGQPLIVNFFASWCAPCKQETPLLARFYRTSGSKPVIIGVDADDSAPAARQFLATEGVTYPVAFEATPAVADAWGVSQIGIPETFFLDSQHRIVKRVLGDVTMKELTEGTAMIRPSATKDRG
jgi:thiol-disulfide isomerase/thioredoxin